MTRRRTALALAILALAITAAIDPRYLLVPLFPLIVALPFLIVLGTLILAGWLIYRVVHPSK